MTGSPKARDESGTIQPGEPTVIYPLVSGSGNDRVLKEWIAGHDSYLLANDDRPIVDAEFDVCVVDKDGLQQYKDDLKQVKSAAKPALLPVLLLLSEHQSDIIETDRGEIADNVLVSTVDEIVSLPIRQAELEWRIGALLRLRDQSLDLQTQTRQLRRFQEAVEASGHAIFITDADGTIEYVNTAFEEITGYSRAEVMGETPDILNSGKMSVEYYEELWETISSGSVWEGEIVDRRKDGELYTSRLTSRSARNCGTASNATGTSSSGWRTRSCSKTRRGRSSWSTRRWSTSLGVPKQSFSVGTNTSSWTRRRPI